MMRVENLGLLDYREAHRAQLQLVERLQHDPGAADTCLLVEHPPVFTLGRNGSAAHIGVDELFLQRQGIDVVRVERGGEVTYHGPGQLVLYPVVNLTRRRLRVADFVHRLEAVMLEAVTPFAIEAGRDPRNRGIWVGGRKLGSIGIAIRRGVSFHGLALNVNTDLTPFSWVNPCGLSGIEMTSMARELGGEVALDRVREALIRAVEQVFGEPRRSASTGLAAAVAKEAARARRPKPGWLKKRLPSGPEYERIRRLVGDSSLHTVCREARCPNQFECYGKGTATFMIMGDRCTRDCRFCAVQHGPPGPLDRGEPARIGAAVAEMGLDYAVVTSVTRDDLADGGASHFVETIEAIRRRCPQTLVEVLIPDLGGDHDALAAICRSRPAVLNHNVETVAELYPLVRPQARYRRSLDLLRRARQLEPGLLTKSGLMVGLGEGRQALVRTMEDLRQAGCEILTIGQYLQPSPAHLPVKRFVPPEEFEELERIARDLGFGGVAAGPHVRSSYQAGRLYRQSKAGTDHVFRDKPGLSLNAQEQG